MKAIKTFLLILGLIAVCSGVRADITGSNLMLADNTNTVRTSDNSSDWASISNPPPGSQWFDRSVGSNVPAFVLGVDPVLGAVDVSYSASAAYGTEIRSTISGLNVGMRYNLWVITSLIPGDTSRSINATFDDGSAYATFNVNNGTDTGIESHSGWFLYEALLGSAVVDANGEINVLVSHASGAERSVYHGVAYSPALDAWNPSPADGTMRLFPETDPVLGWNAGQDPANPDSANPAILEHVVYMGILSEPNAAPVLTEATRFAAAGGTAEWNPTGQWEIERDQFVYWSIGEATVAGTTDPNLIIAGPVWFFSTASAYAEIDPATPADSRVDLGETASFSISATNPFTEPADSTGLSYQWYSGLDMDDPAKELLSGETSTTLEVTDVVADDEGNYFCLVTVDSNGNSISNSGYLIVKRLVGHWKLDGNADDELGNNGVEVGDNVSYVAGVDGDCMLVDNVDVDGGGEAILPFSCIEVAHGDAYRDDAFTVSCWFRSVSPGFTGDFSAAGVVGKTDSTGQEYGWRLRKNGTSYGAVWSTGGSYALASTKSEYFGWGTEWHNLVCVYDEGNNFKAIYVDGVLDAIDAELDRDDADIASFIADGTMYIGASLDNGVLKSPGDVMVDDVQLYNYALDKFEIGQIYVDVANESICVEYPEMDLDEDCDVDLDDLKLFIADWLECGIVPDCNI